MAGQEALQRKLGTKRVCDLLGLDNPLQCSLGKGRVPEGASGSQAGPVREEGTQGSQLRSQGRQLEERVFS